VEIYTNEKHFFLHQNGHSYLFMQRFGRFLMLEREGELVAGGW
jgi:hypothetical protein